MSATYFLFTQLSVDNLTPGKAFDGLTVVETHDMNGRPVKVESSELATYLKNTQAAIAATKDASGNIVGLPIDAGKTGDHDNGDAGGWIVGVQLAGNVLQLIPKWTKLGIESITNSIRRFFSATIDMEKKVILGGTLTNWPAVRDAEGKVLLRPIELSHNIYRLSEALAMDEAMMNQIKQGFLDAMKAEYPDQTAEVMSVDDTSIVCKLADQVYKVPYTMGDNGPMFAPRDQWETVEPGVVQAAMKLLSSLFKKPQPKEKEVMTKLSDLSQADRQALVNEVLGGPDFKNLATELAKEARAQALNEFRLQANKVQRESAVAELSIQLVEGTTEMPRALKNVKPEELQKHLNSLSIEESKWFGELLLGIARDGLIEFTEVGHSRKSNSLQSVPEWARAQLSAVVAEGIRQKDTEKRVTQFFDLAGLGDPKHYDLTAYMPANGNGKEK